MLAVDLSTLSRKRVFRQKHISFRGTLARLLARTPEAKTYNHINGAYVLQLRTCALLEQMLRGLGPSWDTLDFRGTFAELAPVFRKLLGFPKP